MCHWKLETKERQTNITENHQIGIFWQMIHILFSNLIFHFSIFTLLRKLCRYFLRFGVGIYKCICFRTYLLSWLTNSEVEIMTQWLTNLNPNGRHLLSSCSGSEIAWRFDGKIVPRGWKKSIRKWKFRVHSVLNYEFSKKLQITSLVC